MASLVRRLTWSSHSRPSRTIVGDTTIIKQGNLKKKGHIRRNWLSRWFVLTPSGLFYYKDSESAAANLSKPQGTVQLVGCTVKEDLFQRHENVLTIWTADGKDYHMQSESKVDMVDWIQAIEKVSKQKLAERRLTTNGAMMGRMPEDSVMAAKRSRCLSTDLG